MRVRFVALVLVVLLGLIGWASGTFSPFTDADAVRAMLIEWGAWGYLLYILCFAFIEPLGVPGFMFIVPASLVWPKSVAFLLSLAGGVGAGAFGFLFARFVARGWVEQRLPDRFRRFDELFGEHAFKAVVLARLAFFLVPPSHWALGLSKIRFVPFALGTLAGIVPGVAALTFLGGGLVEWMLEGRPAAWILAVLAGIAALAWRWMALRREQSMQ